MKDKHGNEIIENINTGDPAQLTHEELIAKTISGVLDQQALRSEAAIIEPEKDADPFDLTMFNSENNIPDDQFQTGDSSQYNQNDNPGLYDQFGRIVPNVNNGQDPNYINNSNQQVYTPAVTADPRYDALSAEQLAIGKRTQMNSFMMELNNAIAESPEMLNGYKNAAIEEAKKSINSGQYIGATDLLSFLHGKKALAGSRNVEINQNPLDGGTDLNPSTGVNPINLNEMTAEEMVEKFGNIEF